MIHAIARRLFSLGSLAARSVGLLMLMFGAAQSATVSNILYTGHWSNRVDVVILGDGYTSAQMTKFRSDASKFVASFLGQEPFKAWKSSFNFLRIETPSVQSGAGWGTGKNTVYGSYYNCYNIERLLCADDVKVYDVLNKNLPVARYDIVFVLVNDSRYGGSGGAYAVSSTNEYAPLIALHEIGHSFGNLDDEYVDAPLCGFYTQPTGINVSNSPLRSALPWAVWVKAATPLPTTGSTSAIGAYQGAFYCARNWYRPTVDSMMRTLGVAYREVNSEALIRRIYGIVSLVDARTPLQRSVTIYPNQPVTFSVKVGNAGNAVVGITWRLNGVTIGTGPSVTVWRTMLQGGTRTLNAIVRARTPNVRRDPDNRLLDVASWTVSP